MRSNRLFTFLLVMLLFISLSFISGTDAIRLTPTLPVSIIKQIKPATDTTCKKRQDTSLTIIGVGDIMLGTNFPSPNLLPPADSENLLFPATNLLSSADYTFGNLEGTILDSGGTQKKCRDSNVCYLFRMPEKLAPYLKKAGFDVVSMANNHSGDFGPEGRSNTLRVLEKLQIGTCGLLVKPYSITTKNHIRYGTIAFAPNSGTLNINNIDSVRGWIAELRPKCDILIVSFHGGGEGRGRQHIVDGYETFCGENRGNVKEFAHAVIDAGADVVFGQGPHVPRAMELYNNKIIAYSLGNFCTYKRFSLGGENSYAPLLKVAIDKKGNFVKGHIYSFVQKGEGGPVADATQRAFLKIKSLTNEDIPDSHLVFKSNGDILKGKKYVPAKLKPGNL
jgi:hypothetical protein